MRWAVGHLVHTAAYHSLRLPKYAGKLALRAPVGAVRLVSGAVRWLFDWEGETLRQSTSQTRDGDLYLKLSRQRDRRVRWRGIVTVFTLAVTLAGGVAVALAPSWARWAVLALLVTLCGMFGQPADKPLLDTAVVIPGSPG